MKSGNTPKDDILGGEILDEEWEINADELCRHCALEIDRLVTLVDEGIVEIKSPEGVNDVHAWRFRYTSIRRIRTAMRLQRDLGVNLAGAALALDLLDRIAELERRLR